MTKAGALGILRARLAGHAFRDLPPHERRRAAVLVPLFCLGGELHLLLTKRTDTVEYHKGQISFPGGRHEEGDADLLATALRETYEEIGLLPQAVEVLGRLDEIETVGSGFAVTPFVGLVPNPAGLRPNRGEIEEMIELPLAAFMDPANLRIERIVREGREMEVLFYTCSDHVVWGATARIVRGLTALIADRAEGPP